MRTITINEKEIKTPKVIVGFFEIQVIGGIERSEDAVIQFESETKNGTLKKGETVDVENGMAFTITKKNGASNGKN